MRDLTYDEKKAVEFYEAEGMSLNAAAEKAGISAQATLDAIGMVRRSGRGISLENGEFTGAKATWCDHCEWRKGSMPCVVPAGLCLKSKLKRKGKN